MTVGAKNQRNRIAGNDSDAVYAKFTSQMSNNFLTIFQFYPIQGVGENFGDLTFDGWFFH